MDQTEILTRGGVYLARLNPTKGAEVGKIRPVVLMMAQFILQASPKILFVCPLSSTSHKVFSHLHVRLTPRDNLKATSFALVEHCRSISFSRVAFPRLAQLTPDEQSQLIHRLQRMVGV